MNERRVIDPGESHPLEDTFCQRIIDGRLAADIPDVAAVRREQDLPTYAFEIGSYVGVPIFAQGGGVRGTLCCFSANARTPLSEREIRKVRLVADVIGKMLERAVNPADPCLAPHQ